MLTASLPPTTSNIEAVLKAYSFLDFPPFCRLARLLRGFSLAHIASTRRFYPNLLGKRSPGDRRRPPAPAGDSQKHLDIGVSAIISDSEE